MSRKYKPTVPVPVTSTCVKFDIPDSEVYRRIVYTHIQDLSKWYTWKDGTENGKEVAEAFRKLIFESLKFDECGGGGEMSCCDDVRVIRNTQIINLRVDARNQYNTWNGDTLINNITTTNNITTIYGGGVEPNAIARDNALCWASSVFVELITAQAKAKAIGQITDVANVASVVGGFVSGALIIMSGPAGWALAGLAVATFSQIFGNSLATIEAATYDNSQFREDIACTLYNYLRNRSTAFSDWNIDTVNFLPATPPQRVALATAIDTFLNDPTSKLTNWQTFIRILSEAIVITTNGIPLQCPCEPEPAPSVSFYWAWSNLATPLVPPAGWTFATDRGLMNVPVPFRGYGQYLGSGATTTSTLLLAFDMPATTITRFQLQGFRNSTNATNATLTYRIFRFGQQVYSGSTALANRNNGNQFSTVFPPSVVGDRIEITATATQTFSGVCIYTLFIT